MRGPTPHLVRIYPNKPGDDPEMVIAVWFVGAKIYDISEINFTL